jgi:NAD(P)-dependent dehydrogenase (short-subunit alcohol dehydrogenase family)
MVRSNLSRGTVARLSGRIVVVTGSSRGIGRETARLLLGAGASVVLNGRTLPRLSETEAMLHAEFPTETVSACAADISSPEGARILAAHIEEQHGRLDLLINNAGVSMRGPIGELSSETVVAMIEGNLTSALQTTRACLPLLEGARGHVSFVSTIGALHGFPGISVYSAAKGALERFTESFNAEYRSRGVTAGIVYLGFVENDPDKEVYSASGERFHHQRRAMQSQTEAATAIITAAVRRRQRAITAGRGVLLDIAHRISPGLVTRVLARSGGSIHSVDRSS